MTYLEKIESKININKLKELYNTNSLYFCAKYFEIHSQTLTKILIKNNIPIKSRYSGAVNRYYITKEQEKVIIKMYKEIPDMTLIGEKLNIKMNAIRKTLITNQISIRKGTSLGNCKNQFIEKNIIKDYLNGFSFYDIGNKYGVSFPKSKQILKKFGYDSRKLFKYKLNENYFEKIDDFYKAYFLGLLYADGYIGKYRSSYENNRVGFINLSLQERDGYLVEKLKEVIDYGGPIRTINKGGNRQKQKSIRVANINFANHLLKHGLHPKKSFTCQFPDLPEHLISAFILGVFDGDGSMSFSSKDAGGYLRSNCQIIGSIEFIKYIQNYINKHIEEKESSGCFMIRECKNGKLAVIKWSNPKHLIKIYHLFYTQAPFFLKRKKDKFLEFFKLKNINN